MGFRNPYPKLSSISERRELLFLIQFVPYIHGCTDELLLLSLQSKHIQGIKTSVLYVNNQPNMITLDYQMEVSEIFPEEHTR